jgi:hypothetical protein
MLVTVAVPPKIENFAVCGDASTSKAEMVIVVGGVQLAVGGEYPSVTEPVALPSVRAAPEAVPYAKVTLQDELLVS